ncbi:MAG: hypothetical protein Ta2A_07680 [Treponemataceae bacterium]|nr:MAG: hypothetical protein Ta2A_07680 [Treponemataceae bacterium]
MNNTGRGTFREHPERINRKGRPRKGDSCVDILEYELDRAKKVKIDGVEKSVLYRHSIMRKLVELADKGDMQAIKYVCDRTLGKPTQAIETNGNANTELFVSFKTPVKVDADDNESGTFGEPAQAIEMDESTDNTLVVSFKTPVKVDADDNEMEN